ncbi:MAG: helix-turn-helix domain-containing protein [Ferrovibrionaceae bacterium]
MPVAGDDIFADAMRIAILLRLLQRQETEQAGTALPAWRLTRVFRHVEEHLDGPITLQDMAAAAGLSRMHFAAQFRAATGQRPHDYLLRRRIERAQSLMREDGASLVDVALSVGFQTQAHFTTVFKRICGETPHRWRSRERRLQDEGAA